MEIREEMMLPTECCAQTMLLDSSSGGGDPRGDRVPRSLASSEYGGEEEEEEEDVVGRAWRSDDDGSDSEAPRVVGGGGLVLSAEERRRLDEALEDLDDGSSVDSETWDLVPKSRAKRRTGGRILPAGEGDAELYSSVTRLLAAKRRSDAKVSAGLRLRAYAGLYSYVTRLLRLLAAMRSSDAKLSLVEVISRQRQLKAKP